MFTRVFVTQWKPPTLSQGNRWTPPPITTTTTTHTQTHIPLILHPQCELADIPHPRVRWPFQTPISSSSVPLVPVKQLLTLPTFKTHWGHIWVPSVPSVPSVPFLPILPPSTNQRWGGKAKVGGGGGGGGRRRNERIQRSQDMRNVTPVHLLASCYYRI